MNSNFILIFLLTLFLAACHILDSKERDTTSLHNHPLIGQIWDMRAERVITQHTLLQQAAEARYVLLGETHDSEEQHHIQAEVLAALVEKGMRPALAMEQFDTEHQAA